MKMKHVVLGLAMVFGMASAAHATVIDFEPLRGTGDTVSSGYEENGFQLVTNSSSGVFNVWDGYIVPTVTALVSDAGGTTTLSKTDGGLFQLNSIDLAIYYYSYPIDVTFTGLLADGDTVEQTFNLGSGLQTFLFKDDFTNLVSVSFVQGTFTAGDFGKIYQFTNINVTPVDGSAAPVPEPATMLLFGAGLLGLAGISRRKN
ncbi:MAG: PEP-CTERM sorting domain-containing protein [Proteobacteria bacterium]|nr:PEP-CTERM sorting domain-containing protein [Pseudomonadota bacterium]